MFPSVSVGRGAVDQAIPGSHSLLTEPVPAPVVALFQSAGSSLTGLRAVQSSWWPGDRLIVRYAATANGGSLEGKHQLVMAAGQIPSGAALVKGPDGDVGTWIVPHDPDLPGLGPALDQRRVAELMGDLGVGGAVTSVRFRSYRPTRRAVVEVVGSSGSLFLKVVRPGSAQALHDKHRLLASSMKVPNSLGVSVELGIVVLEAIPGRDLRSLLRSGDELWPPPDEIAALPGRLPQPAPGATTRSSIESLPRIVDLLSRVVPKEKGRLDDLVAAVGPDTTSPTVPVHGDFHDGQVVVDAGRPTGLIDIDTFGQGRPGDDAATMVGHLNLVATSAVAPERVRDYAVRVQGIWEAEHDPADLRARIAAVTLGQATGPFRVQSPDWPSEVVARIDAALRWADSAVAMADEKSLIRTSGGSHVSTAGYGYKAKELSKKRR